LSNGLKILNYVKGNIYDFIASSEKVDIVVDCENSDPYKLCASLRDLEHEYISKISRIILVDDEHTSTMWRILERFTDIQVEHIMTERIKQNKSLVDMKLAIRTCQEHYQKEVDAFILICEERMDSIKKAEYINYLWESNDYNLLRLFFGRKANLFKQIDIELMKLTSPGIYEDEGESENCKLIDRHIVPQTG